MGLVVTHAERHLVSDLSTGTQFLGTLTTTCIFSALKGRSFIHRKRFGCPRGVKTIADCCTKDVSCSLLCQERRIGMNPVMQRETPREIKHTSHVCGILWYRLVMQVNLARKIVQGG